LVFPVEIVGERDRDRVARDCERNGASRAISQVRLPAGNPDGRLVRPYGRFAASSG